MKLPSRKHRRFTFHTGWYCLLFACLIMVMGFSCEDKPLPGSPREELLVDGAGIPYRSFRFAVHRPSAEPYPDRLGQSRYAYFVDGPGSHVEQLTAHRFQNAWIFTEQLGAVREDSAWGFIDRKGVYRIPPQFQWAEPFSEGLAAVKVQGLYGYVDTSGDFQIPPRFRNARFFESGLAPVLTENGWSFIDRNGAFAITGPFELAESFSGACDLAAVKLPSGWGFIDARGHFVLPPQYEDVRGFAVEGLTPLAWVKYNGSWTRTGIPEAD